MRLIVALLIVAATLGVADAYPQFQLSHEASCAACHLSPAGGGLLNDYGREEAGATISRGGDGRLLHGLWDSPEWFEVGGDFRFAFAGKQPGLGSGEVLIFPMQADLYTRATKGAFAFAFTAGVRGVARNAHPPQLLERLQSREHYLAYTDDKWQLRVGRFYPVWGLRLADHTAYVRRFMGFNIYEEPYGVELAHYGDTASVHLTAFVPPPSDFLGSGVRRSGASLTVEDQVDDTLIAGFHARGAVGDADAVWTVGTFGKRWFPDAEILVLGQLDLQRQTFFGDGPSRTQLAGYLGASKWLTKGVMVSGAAHLWEPDVMLRSTTRHAVELTSNYFPRAHFELQLLLRAMAQGELAEDPGYLGLLQVHYYL